MLLFLFQVFYLLLLFQFLLFLIPPLGIFHKSISKCVLTRDWWCWTFSVLIHIFVLFWKQCLLRTPLTIILLRIFIGTRLLLLVLVPLILHSDSIHDFAALPVSSLVFMLAVRLIRQGIVLLWGHCTRVNLYFAVRCLYAQCLVASTTCLLCRFIYYN